MQPSISPNSSAKPARIMPSNLLNFPKPVEHDGPEGPDSTPHSLGATPSERRAWEKRDLIVLQFREEDGDARRVARRHGIEQAFVTRIVARHLNAMRRPVGREIDYKRAA